MDISIILNILFGGGLLGTAAALLTLRSTVRKARAEAEKTEAEAETVRIDNAEHATRILMENIVKPLKEEMDETKKELARNTREMARLRKALNTANNCDYHADCPVLYSLREQKDRGAEPGAEPRGVGKHRQRGKREAVADDGGGAEVGSEPDDTSGQPP